MTFSTHHINYLDRTSFLDEKQAADLRSTPWLSIRSQSLHLVKVASIPRPASSTSTQVPRATEIMGMGDVLAGLYGLKQSFVYAIIGEPTQISLLMATCQHQLGNSLEVQKPDRNSPLPALLSGAYPGIEIHSIETSSTSSLISKLARFPAAAILTGTPTLKHKSNPTLERQIDRLIRALYGTTWAYLVVAQPMPLSELQTLLDATLNELRVVTNTERSPNSININPTAEKYKQSLNRFWNKLQSGKSQGMWHAIGYLLAADVPTIDRAKAVARSVFSGSSSAPDPVQVLDTGQIAQKVASFALPLLPPPQHPPGKVQYPYQYLSLLNSTELAALVRLPTQEMPGYFVRPQARFDVNPHQTPAGDRSIEIGEILNRGSKTGVSYTLDLNTLTRHAMVVGTTGSGKTNTIFHLLKQLARSGVPFLVIEPAKTEYRALLDSEMGDYLRIFTLGEETISPFRLNPFQILPGVSVQSHIDGLKSVFNASFVMYAPMPYVLERCIHEIYEDKGWDLVTSENRRCFNSSIHPRAYPTLSDLYEKIEEVVEQLGYESKITMDIKAALKTRINSLRIGGKGLMLDTHTSLPIPSLLGTPTILELDRIGDDEEKAFLIGLVLMFLYEHYRSTGHQEEIGLKHLTVVEEAHRLLRNAPPVTDLEAANMAGKAVESFCNLLAEIRAYGEGIVVAEQIPTKLAPDIIKNTHLKIVHRLMAEEDRQLIGSAMCLESEQSRWLASASVGDAVAFGDGDDSPMQVKVPYVKPQQVSSGRESEERVREIMANFYVQNKGCFNLYPWSPLEPEIIQRNHRAASRIVERSEFKEVFAKSIISIVVEPSTLVRELQNLVQVIRKYGKQIHTTQWLQTILIYGIDWFLEMRGRQNGIAYTDLPKLKRVLSEILLDNVRSPQNEESSNSIATFQTEFKNLLTCKTQPFIGCDRVCAKRGCLYRYHVAPLVRDAYLARKFVDALDAERKEISKRTYDVAYHIATRRIIAEQVPAQEKRLAALCFTIQAAENHPMLDTYHKENLINGILDFPFSDE